MGVDVQRHAPAVLTRESHDTNCVGGWAGPRVGLDGCEKSRPYRDSISGPYSPSESRYRLRYQVPLRNKQTKKQKLYKRHKNTQMTKLIISSYNNFLQRISKYYNSV
jgi:hypothetical protein